MLNRWDPTANSCLFTTGGPNSIVCVECGIASSTVRSQMRRSHAKIEMCTRTVASHPRMLACDRYHLEYEDKALLLTGVVLHSTL